MSTPKTLSRACGIDVGTMFFQTAENDSGGKVDTRSIRNAFTDLEMTDATKQMLDQNAFHYVTDKKNAYVIGDDAMNLARMLPGKVELRRPLQDGVLNAGEDMKMLVLNELIRSTIGKAPDKKSVVCTCVSSAPIDGSANNTFHERRLKGMFENQGWHTVIIEEALAVILSERPTIIEDDGTETPYTGIGVSFGAGRVNAVLAYKGVTAVGMSASRCLSKDTLVMVADGLKPISQIEVGETVITASGVPSKVVKVWNNGSRDKLRRINCESLAAFPLDVTPDHRVLVWGRIDGKPIWKKAADVTAGDLLREPVVRFDGSRDHHVCVDDDGRRTVVRKSKAFGRIVGAFLGDGSVNDYKDSGAYVQIALNAAEQGLADDYAAILGDMFDRNCSAKVDGSVCRVKLHHTAVARHFARLCYAADGTKQLNIPPEQITDTMAVGILQGLIESDGNKCGRSGSGYEVTNTSRSVILLAHQLLNRLGVRHSISVREPREGGVNCRGHQIVGSLPSYSLRISSFASRVFDAFVSHESFGGAILPSYVERAVQSVEDVEYSGDVYDLTIEDDDHAFGVVGGVVHNCGDWIDKEVAAQINVPVAKVTAYKEKQLDFDAIEEAMMEGRDIDDLPFALDSYYEAMLKYVFEMFATKFNTVKSDFDKPLDIVVAGGTSMPKGFIGKLERVVRSLDLPFQIKEIRHSADPRNAVVKGLLVRASLSAKELAKKDSAASTADDILK